MAEDPVVDTPTPEPEPEGVVEMQGQKMVPLSALTAERDRVRSKTEEKIRAEYEPVKAKAAEAERLAADLAAVQPHLDYLRKHPEVMRQPEPDTPQIPDEEAEKFARDFELYTPTGVDVARAKRILAKSRAETAAAAKAAADQAVQPVMQSAAVQSARQNYLWAASQRGNDGAPLVDSRELANLWATFPPELTANPEVARVVLDAAIGMSVRGGRRATRTESEPVFTEQPGGQRQAAFQMSDREKRMAQNIGLNDKQWKERAEGYRPDAVNILGD